MSRFLDITIGGAVIAALVTGVFGIYGLGEAARQRLEWDQYTRKAEIYETVLREMGGFYENAKNARARKDKVLEAFRLCELHCPDQIIRAGNAFLNTVAVGARSSEEEQQQALGMLREEMRRDLWPESKLSIEEFRSWGSR